MTVEFRNEKANIQSRAFKFKSWSASVLASFDVFLPFKYLTEVID